MYHSKQLSKPRSAILEETRQAVIDWWSKQERDGDCGATTPEELIALEGEVMSCLLVGTDQSLFKAWSLTASAALLISGQLDN